MENETNNPQQLQVELTPEVAGGTYTNLAVINHSHQEFVIDFIAALSGLPKARVSNRMILTPESAKRLLFALQDNVMKYEQQFGTINLGGVPAPKSEGIGRTATPFGLGEGDA